MEDTVMENRNMENRSTKEIRQRMSENEEEVERGDGK